MVDPTRSVGNTVRKVGLEGRGDESILGGVVLDDATPPTHEAA